jgi:hypothetical protein
MKQLVQTLLVLLAIPLPCMAQQPGLRVGVPLQQRSDKASTNNYRLELEMKRGDRVARYQIAFNGGSISTELVDKLSDGNSGEPRIISFSAQFTELDGGGGEVSVHIGRSLPFKVQSRVIPAGSSTSVERDVTQHKSIGLSTKVALFPAKPVTIFDDEEERITLKLTSLGDVK